MEPFTGLYSIFRQIVVDFRNVSRPAKLNGAFVRVFDGIAGTGPRYTRNTLDLARFALQIIHNRVEPRVTVL